MSKHTPGPWVVLNSRKEEWYGRELDYWTVTADGKDKWVCASPEWDPEHDEESSANASLIAAAPDLLEALELAVAELHSINSHYGDKENAMDHSAGIRYGEAAIAKAKGGV